MKEEEIESRKEVQLLEKLEFLLSSTPFLVLEDDATGNFDCRFGATPDSCCKPPEADDGSVAMSRAGLWQELDPLFDPLHGIGEGKGSDATGFADSRRPGRQFAMDIDASSQSAHSLLLATRSEERESKRLRVGRGGPANTGAGATILTDNAMPRYPEPARQWEDSSPSPSPQGYSSDPAADGATEPTWGLFPTPSPGGPYYYVDAGGVHFDRILSAGCGGVYGSSGGGYGSDFGDGGCFGCCCGGMDGHLVHHGAAAYVYMAAPSTPPPLAPSWEPSLQQPPHLQAMLPRPLSPLPQPQLLRSQSQPAMASGGDAGRSAGFFRMRGGVPCPDAASPASSDPSRRGFPWKARDTGSGGRPGVILRRVSSLPVIAARLPAEGGSNAGGAGGRGNGGRGGSERGGGRGSRGGDGSDNSDDEDDETGGVAGSDCRDSRTGGAARGSGGSIGPARRSGGNLAAPAAPVTRSGGNNNGGGNNGGGNGGGNNGGTNGGCGGSGGGGNPTGISTGAAATAVKSNAEEFASLELDPALWIVVERGAVCTEAAYCGYFSPVRNQSTRRHFHAVCSHRHKAGARRGLPFHTHQLEKAWKHQRSHNKRHAVGSFDCLFGVTNGAKGGDV